MKTLLVLYPIYPYAYALIGPQEPYEIKKKYGHIYQRLMNKRYPDFQRVWVMFSNEDFLEKPDMSMLWEGINIGKNDIVTACGVTFNDHTAKGIYPANPEIIINACPQPIERLVVGGFHFWDCVETVAKYAYEKGIRVMVDDDLTDFFFWKVKNNKGVPSSSCIPSSFADSIKMEQKKLRKYGFQRAADIRKARENKPWLVEF